MNPYDVEEEFEEIRKEFPNIRINLIEIFKTFMVYLYTKKDKYINSFAFEYTDTNKAKEFIKSYLEDLRESIK